MIVVSLWLKHTELIITPPDSSDFLDKLHHYRSQWVQEQESIKQVLKEVEGVNVTIVQLARSMEVLQQGMYNSGRA